MTRRTERLDRLVISSPCRAPARRVCAVAGVVIGALIAALIGATGVARAEAPGPALAPFAPLHALLAQSSLVVIATVGPSSTLAAPDPDALEREARTELQGATVLKGSLPGGTVRVDRVVFSGDESAPREGDTVLAFLTAPAEGMAAPGEPLYALTDPFGDLRRLPADALRAYRRRIAALARLGEAPRAGELLEWLVATAEDEPTRREAVGTLRQAVEALDGRAAEWARRGAPPGSTEADLPAEADRRLARAGEQGDQGDGVEPAVLGALLTPEHQQRLSRALLATRRLTEADLDLYELVQPWAGEAALRWLAARLEEGPERPLAWQAMRRLATDLGDDALQQLLDRAARETVAVDDEPARAGETEEARDERRDALVEAIEQELRRTFLHAIDGRL